LTSDLYARRREIRPVLQRPVDQRVDVGGHEEHRKGVAHRRETIARVRRQPHRHGQGATGDLQVPIRRLEVELRLREQRFGLQHVGDGGHARTIALPGRIDGGVRFRHGEPRTRDERALRLIGEVRTLHLQRHALERGVVREIQRDGRRPRRGDRAAPTAEIEQEV